MKSQILRPHRFHVAGALSTRRVSPLLAWGDFHARSLSARSTIPEEKWGTTRSLQRRRRLRKPHLKSEFALPQTLSRLIYLV